MMLLYLDSKNGQMSLMSLPRDTYTDASWSVPKLNSVYGANDGGKEGMEVLLDYVKKCIGYRPDGYILVDLDCFEKLVDLMGGVRFNVPMDMSYSDPSQELEINLTAGSDAERPAVHVGRPVPFRLSMADLQRVQVQRDFMQAAMAPVVQADEIPALSGGSQPACLEYDDKSLSAEPGLGRKGRPQGQGERDAHGDAAR